MFDPDGSRNDMGAYGGSRACQDYPSYVKGLKAIAESAIVRLTWDANAQSESVSYYIVYRDTVSNFMPDATKHHRDVTGPSFADTVGLNKSCAYRIAAVNNHCYEGGYSVPITVETASLREGRLATSYYWGCGDESYIRGSVVAKGVGLKSTGSGTIVLAGVPQGANLLKTLLYWDRCPYVLLNGVRIGATKIGTDDGVSAYRADVSHIVNGNGTYEVATDGWSDGASLVVVYEDSTMDSLRAITINDGLDNEGHGSGGGAFDTTYFAHDQQESVYVCYVVGGGSAGLSDAYLYNGQPLALNACDATDGASWDTDWYLVPPEFVRPQPGHPQCSADVIEYTDSLHWIAAINLGLLLPAGVSNKNDGADYSWALAGVTPNPSGSASVVQFDVPEGGGTVSLMVYDAGGRLVSTLVDGRVDAGRHTVEWNATNGQGGQVAPGIYFIRMEAGSCRATKKVALVK
jgi:hypothetical protein